LSSLSKNLSPDGSFGLTGERQDRVDPKAGAMKVQLSCDSIPKAIPNNPDISMDREIIPLDDTFAKRVLIDPRSHQYGKNLGLSKMTALAKLESLLAPSEAQAQAKQQKSSQQLKTFALS
jgi:hypothetical protein